MTSPSAWTSLSSRPRRPAIYIPLLRCYDQASRPLDCAHAQSIDGENLSSRPIDHAPPPLDQWRILSSGRDRGRRRGAGHGGTPPRTTSTGCSRRTSPSPCRGSPAPPLRARLLLLIGMIGSHPQHRRRRRQHCPCRSPWSGAPPTASFSAPGRWPRLTAPPDLAQG